MSIGLVDLARQRAALEPEMSRAIAAVLDHGAFVNGPEVAALEAALADMVGVRHVIGCANGTDALQLLLRAAGIGAGSAVFIPSLTFVATAEAVALTGAVPVFVDVDPQTGTMAPHSLAEAVAMEKARGALRPAAALTVDLFSIPSDYPALAAICSAHGMRLFADAAHSIGSQAAQGACGALGCGAATSFYPSKALGCYGDGGAVFTADSDLADRVRGIANHGMSAGGADHVWLGTNSRLDTLQAAVLLQKLRLFDTELKRRREIAARYRAAFAGLVDGPEAPAGADPCWSYFCIQSDRRDALQAALAGEGIRSVAYYRSPTHDQPAFRHAPRVPGGLPGTEAFAARLLCLPLHPYMTEAEVDRVVAAVEGFGAA